MWPFRRKVCMNVADEILASIDTTWRWRPTNIGSWRRIQRGQARLDLSEHGVVWACVGDVMVARFTLSEASPAVRAAFEATLRAITLDTFNAGAKDGGEDASR